MKDIDIRVHSRDGNKPFYSRINTEAAEVEHVVDLAPRLLKLLNCFAESC